MSTQLVLGVVGAVALGPLGAGIVSAGTGFVIGSTLGGLVDRPDGPSPGDLTAPQLQEGAALVRPYGTVMLVVNPVSVSDYTATANDTGGKGGPPDGSAGYTYTLDVLGTIAHRVPSMPIVAILRVWVNKKLVETRLAASTTASLAASEATTAYTSLTLYPGGSSQVPPPQYETRVGTANASAYRNVATVEIIGLSCGGSKTPPLVEVEVTTSATTTIPALRAVFGLWKWVGPLTSNCGTADNGTDYIFSGLTLGDGAVAAAIDRLVSWQPCYLNNIGTCSAPTWYFLDTGTQTPPSEASILASAGIVGVQYMCSGAGQQGTVVVQITYEQPPNNYTPLPVSLQSIVNAELALNPAIVLADHNTSDLSAVTVRGFKAIGPPGKTIAELGDIFYFDGIPANPIKYVRRGVAVVGTILNADTGVGVDEAGDPFTGLKIGNDIERPSVVGLSAPNASADHEPVFRRGDRLTTDGPDIEKRRTEVGLTPAETQGRALAMTLVARASSHTAEYGLSDKYAVAEPGDAYNVYDDLGNLYNKLIRSLTYADGVKQCKWELNDTSALIETGITDATYTPSLIVNAPASTTLLPLDIPILQDADDNAGFYAVASSASTSWPGATLYESTDGVTYTQVGTFTTKAVTGAATTTTALGDWPTPWQIDNRSSVTVSVNGTLASYSFDNTVAGLGTAYLIGNEIVYAMTATLVSAGVYTLSNFIRGLNGTESFTGTHAINDRIVVLTTAGIIRVSGQAANLNVSRQYKVVTLGGSLASATAQAFKNTGVGLKPYAPVNLKKEITDSATVVTWNRRTRLSSTLLGTTAPALGEASESYDVELYDAAAALVSSSTVSTNLWSASAAAAFEHFVIPVLDIRTISSERVGLREDAAPNYAFVRQTIAGGLIAQSPNLGSAVYQTATDGDELYAVTADLTTFTPSTYINAKAVRFTRTALGAAAATYTAATAGDLHGIAYDGTDIWVTEFYGGNLRRLNKTTLASVATYVVSTGMRSLLFNAGSLWITRDYSSQVIQWNVGTTTETQRFSVVTYPSQLLIVGSLLFVRGDQAVAAYTAATGALVASVTAPKYGLGMYVVGTYIAAVSSYGVVLINSATGLEVTRFDTSITYNGTAYSYIRGVAGVVGTTIYVTLGGPGLSNQTVGFALGAAELTGYTVKVYQKSATVGRGYVASLAL